MVCTYNSDHFLWGRFKFNFLFFLISVEIYHFLLGKDTAEVTLSIPHFTVDTTIEERNKSLWARNKQNTKPQAWVCLMMGTRTACPAGRRRCRKQAASRPGDKRPGRE